MSTFHTLTIQEIIQETASAVSVVFNVPQTLKESFQFTAGQYITLKTTINGEEIRRAYSICSAPQSNQLKVAIKAVENGTFSVYATTQLKSGDSIAVSEPEGKFTLKAEDQKSYIGFAAGSGITPVLSMIKTTLQENNSAKFTLVYGNKSEADVIFKTELENLQNQFSDRFSLHFVYSQQNIDGCLSGRINQNIVESFAKDNSYDAAFLCGPEEMINLAKDTLAANGVSKDDIHFELFTTSISEENVAQIKDGETEVTVLLDDEELTFTMKQKDNLLAASLRNKVDAPYSCQGGVCSSCLAKITEGKAVMTKNSILSDEEVEEGYVLTCQAHPTTPKVFIDFDDV